MMDKNYQRLLEIVQRIHVGCFKLCKDATGEYLPIAGNMGIFCQSEEDFNIFTKIREQITEPSANQNQKYYLLKEPIILPQIGDIPQATYTHLYIRKPSVHSPEEGDVDFVLTPAEYEKFKQEVAEGGIKGASIYNRPGWDNVEVRNPGIKALTYIGTREMAEKVRVKF
jgi:hypothetical protein